MSMMHGCTYWIKDGSFSLCCPQESAGLVLGNWVGDVVAEKSRQDMNRTNLTIAEIGDLGWRMRLREGLGLTHVPGSMLSPGPDRLSPLRRAGTYLFDSFQHRNTKAS